MLSYTNGTGILLAAIMSFFLLLPCKAQEEDTVNRQEEIWIEKTDEYINLKLTQKYAVDRIAVLGDSNNIFLSPNSRITSIFGFNYRFVSVSGGIALKFLPTNNDDDIYGDTKTSSFTINYQPGHWMQELSYKRIKGFYLDNTSDYDSLWTDGMPYIQFPDMVLTSYQGSTAYKFNDRFSLRAITSQTERQVKSAGSTIARLDYNYYIVDDKTATTSRVTQKSNNFALALNGGYYYTQVIKHDFYISLCLAAGGGYLFTKLTTRDPAGDITKNTHSPFFRGDAQAGFGYNGRRFFIGSYVSGFLNSSQQDNTTVIDHKAGSAFKVFAGYRVKAPGIIKKPVDKADKIMNEKIDRILK